MRLYQYALAATKWVCITFFGVVLLLRRVWPVNWSRPFFRHHKEKRKKAVCPRETTRGHTGFFALGRYSSWTISVHHGNARARRGLVTKTYGRVSSIYSREPKQNVYSNKHCDSVIIMATSEDRIPQYCKFQKHVGTILFFLFKP